MRYICCSTVVNEGQCIARQVADGWGSSCLVSPVSLFREFAFALLSKPRGPVVLLELLEVCTVLVSYRALGRLEVGVDKPVVPAGSMRLVAEAPAGMDDNAAACKIYTVWSIGLFFDFEFLIMQG